MYIDITTSMSIMTNSLNVHVHVEHHLSLRGRRRPLGTRVKGT